ncbi:membrane protein insertase YidC [Bacillus sp. REN3]|uniref:membrane protein insertase YidC n=1 Tax=Bacillus sp. REN3 TaxID=2802440 RepID=UPI001AEE7F97|nr:membrane protein insertase YidC [Bacillus sp. REN3]
MKRIFFVMVMLLTPTLLAGCQPLIGEDSFFQSAFINPFTWLIHAFANLTGGSFGMAIILITLLIRFALMPLMLKQYKNQQEMKEKMEFLKPEMDAMQKKLKETMDLAEQKKLQQEMFGLYQKHGVNPLSAGCLPLLVQMPILMGLYYAIRGSTEIASHSFLWFNLGASDIWITGVAGMVYYLQFKVTQANLPEEQRKQMRMMGLLSPIMIVLFSLNAPAALPLYWAAGGSFLILQSLLAKKLFMPEKAEKGGKQQQGSQLTNFKKS